MLVQLREQFLECLWEIPRRVVIGGVLKVVVIKAKPRTNSPRIVFVFSDFYVIKVFIEKFVCFA